MRFASVYCAFESLADFEAEIAALRADHAGRASPPGGLRVGVHDPAPPPAQLHAAP